MFVVRWVHEKAIFMNSRRTIYFDASAAVKLVVNELGSENVRARFAEHHRHFMTNLCFAEALGALKGKMVHKIISTDEYFRACSELSCYLKDRRIDLDDALNIGLETFIQAEALSEKHQCELDLSDALQIVTVKHGRRKSRDLVLATADRELEKAARTEGLCVWNVIDTSEPPA